MKKLRCRSVSQEVKPGGLTPHSYSLLYLVLQSLGGSLEQQKTSVRQRKGKECGWHMSGCIINICRMNERITEYRYRYVATWQEVDWGHTLQY